MEDMYSIIANAGLNGNSKISDFVKFLDTAKMNINLGPARDKSKVQYMKLVLKIYDSEDQTDYLKKLLDLSKNARRWFSMIYDEYKKEYWKEFEKPNVIYMNNDYLTPTQVKDKYNALRELRENNLVRRYKKNRYMVNPSLFAPFKHKDVDEAILIWNKLEAGSI